MDSCNYSLVRSKRRTISLQINRELEVTVRAPMRMPIAEIDLFVAKHSDWIARNRVRLAQESASRREFSFADGDVLPFRGGELIIASADIKTAAIDGGKLILPIYGNRSEAAIALLRRAARERTGERIAFFAPVMGVSPMSVRITSAQSRWGSCSGKNSLSFPWRIAMLPDSLLDYIVVHELAHIREHNHSARFWAVVAGVLPDWAARRADLRELTRSLPL